jgi:hypothetical protein
MQDCLDRLEVACAAAQYTGECFAHFSFCRARVSLQELGSSQNLGRGAVTALDGPTLDKGLLDRVQSTGDLPTLFGVLAERFDRLDLVAFSLSSQVDTRVDRPAVQQYRAGPALTRLTSVFDSKEALPAQNLKQAVTGGG